MEQINSYYNKKTVDISCNICNAIEYYDGTQFKKRLTKSIDISVTAFGQAADCISMYSCL